MLATRTVWLCLFKILMGLDTVEVLVPGSAEWSWDSVGHRAGIRWNNSGIAAVCLRGGDQCGWGKWQCKVFDPEKIRDSLALSLSGPEIYCNQGRSLN